VRSMHPIVFALFFLVPAEELDAGFAGDFEEEQSIEVDTMGNVKMVEENGEISVEFVNKHTHEVDLYWDDGVFGKAISQKVQPGQRVKISTFVGHIFTWTEHGTSRPLSPPVHIAPRRHMYQLTTELVEKSKAEMKCVDRFPKYCQENAGRGECANAPGWMIVHCPKSCNQCELQDPKVRCVRKNLDMVQEPVWSPGDLNKRFEFIMKEFPQYEPKALSSPPGPWLIQLQNFVKPEEAKRLIALNRRSFARSTDQGQVNEFGEMQKVISHSRTSSNSWCGQHCESDPLVASIYERIVNVTGVPKSNYESFQVLEYKKGQFYRTHHDDSGGDTTPAGPRILTFFLYLSDVEKGGETDFPNIGVRAKPKLGSAILWPSMQDSDPTKADMRMYHQAMPVKKGVKYAANAWIHLYDYRVPNLWGCTGSFS